MVANSSKTLMMKSENPKSEEGHELLLPKWAIPIVWTIIVLVIQVLLPWVIAKVGPRLGWYQQGGPSWWNLAGLIVVLVGIVMYAWCLVFHYRSYRTSVRVGFSPPHLVIAGPYRISRNPMYVSGLFVWFGWTIYYGSPTVFVALMLLWSVFTFRVIPHEEQQLEALFGDDYLEYKRSVRRWIGRY
jgi:protein-S-isoprenylcysteine O-methyltransferase Ste14